MPDFDPARFRVDADPRRAETLPPEAFTDEGFLARELETVFRRSWLLVPDREALAMRDDPRSVADFVETRGSRIPFSLLDKPLFLQRDWDGVLRAFPNVCTHAWHTLVAGPERERVIACPQHGRKFECDGRYREQPGFEGVPPRAEDSLRAFPVAALGPFLFACLGDPERPFDDVFGPVRESLARLDLSRFRRAPMAGEARELDGNWKQHAWNYMDRLHIPFIHRRPGGLMDALDMASYRTELHDRSALQWAYARDPAHGFDPALLPDRFRDAERPERRVFALWWLVFPNLALNVYPWGVSVNVFAPVPGKPRRTLFLWYHHVLDADKYARREDVWMNRDVDAEDVEALSQVSRGVASGLAPRGRFAPRDEEGPHWLHRLVSRAVLGE